MIDTRIDQTVESEQLKICIIGGGNIGSLLLGDLGSIEKVSVRLYTSNPEKWNHTMEVCSPDHIVKYNGKIDLISNKPEEVIENADIIISTLPSHIFPATIQRIKPYIKAQAWIGVMPGSGGVEFNSKELIEKGCTLFGFQRVHGIARIKEYGKSVYDLGKKSELHLATIPGEKTEEVCMVMEKLLNIKCHPLPNFLSITLTPSNPILHTTRLYSIFQDYNEGMYWEKEIDFYTEWTDDSSRILIACDEELQKMCRKVAGLDLTSVKSLKKHYESNTPERLTEKISNIPAFKGIKTPMLETENGYIPDFNSRYFLEDFPYGLCIIKDFCVVVGLDTPAIDQVLMWFEKNIGVNYYVNGKFIGGDLNSLPLPSNYGLNKVEEIVSYYS